MVNNFWDNVKKQLQNQQQLKRGWIRLLAEKSHINEVVLANSVRRDNVPYLFDAIRIARALDTTVEELVGSDADLTARPARKKLELKEIAPDYTTDIYPITFYTGAAAGPPIEMNDSAGTYPVPKHHIKEDDPDAYFTLKVQGSSMVEAGIPSGSVILVRSMPLGAVPYSRGIYVFRSEHTNATVKQYIVEPDPKTNRPTNYIAWCDGSGRKQAIGTHDYVILGEYITTL